MYEKRLEESKKSYEESKAKLQENQEQSIFYQKMIKDQPLRKTSFYSNPQTRSPGNGPPLPITRSPQIKHDMEQRIKKLN